MIQDSGTQLSPKTAMLIPVHGIQELFQRIHFGFWLIALPPLVFPHPEDSPSAFCGYEGRFGNLCLLLHSGVTELWSQFENLYTLVVNSTPNVELIPNVSWWSATPQEGLDFFLTPLQFNFAQCHLEFKRIILLAQNECPRRQRGSSMNVSTGL